jgi:hypothetical protein
MKIFKLAIALFCLSNAVNAQESGPFKFKTQKNLYIDLPFFVKIQNIPYLKEIAILKIQSLNFYTFHKGNKIYGYKGKQVRDNIHSHDVACFIEAFIQNPRSGEVYNLGGGKNNTCSI